MNEKRFSSSYHDGMITIVAYIVDIVMERKTNKQGIRLPKYYWRDERFLRDYKLQLIKARSLLKLYSGEAILAALRTKQALSVYSLTARWLDPLIKVEQDKIDLAKRAREAIILEQPIPCPSGFFVNSAGGSRTSIQNKLEGL